MSDSPNLRGEASMLKGRIMLLIDKLAQLPQIEDTDPPKDWTGMRFDLVTRYMIEIEAHLYPIKGTRALREMVTRETDPKTDAKTKRLLHLITDAGEYGLTLSDLCRKARSIDPDERREILRELVLRGDVHEETIGTTTKPIKLFKAVSTTKSTGGNE